MSDDIAIKVDNISKTFKLPHEKHSSIKGALINIGRTKRGYEKQQVLNDISFEIKKGEFFGIVGRNGSGKSTLLKLIAGIYTPDKGAITINGKLTPFIELGVGFNPELSGRENVFLNGALLGFNRKEMDAMYDEIVAFAELERFMDQKLKNYSSGMQVRLAFSIAIRADGDILVLDEVLAVGDEAFQSKCYKYFFDLKSQNKTVVLVTHDMKAVERFCDKALLIEEGSVLVSGDSVDVAKSYKKLFVEISNSQKKYNKTIKNKIISSLECVVVGNNSKNETITANEPFTIIVKIKANKNIDEAAFGINILDSKNNILASMGIGGKNEKELYINKGVNEIRFNIPKNILHNDKYTIEALLVNFDQGIREVVYEKKDVQSFSSTGFNSREHALIYLDNNINIRRN